MSFAGLLSFGFLRRNAPLIEPLPHIPNEVLLNIIKHNVDLKHCRLVSKAWNQCTLPLFNKKYLGKYDCKQLPQSKPLAKNIWLSYQFFTNRRCPLSMNTFKFINSLQRSHFLWFTKSNFKNITNLEFKDSLCYFSQFIMALNKLERLRSLTLSGKTSITLDANAQVLTAPPRYDVYGYARPQLELQTQLGSQELNEITVLLKNLKKLKLKLNTTKQVSNLLSILLQIKDLNIQSFHFTSPKPQIYHGGYGLETNEKFKDGINIWYYNLGLFIKHIANKLDHLHLDFLYHDGGGTNSLDIISKLIESQNWEDIDWKLTKLCFLFGHTSIDLPRFRNIFMSFLKARSTLTECKLSGFMMEGNENFDQILINMFPRNLKTCNLNGLYAVPQQFQPQFNAQQPLQIANEINGLDNQLQALNDFATKTILGTTISVAPDKEFNWFVKGKTWPEPFLSPNSMLGRNLGQLTKICINQNGIPFNEALVLTNNHLQELIQNAVGLKELIIQHCNLNGVNDEGLTGLSQIAINRMTNNNDFRSYLLDFTGRPISTLRNLRILSLGKFGPNAVSDVTAAHAFNGMHLTCLKLLFTDTEHNVTEWGKNWIKTNSLSKTTKERFLLQ